MKRLAILFSCLFALSTGASATSDFNKVWKAEYTKGDDVDADFKKVARKAGCFVCHVKGEKKTSRNEYGTAVSEFLNKDDFPKEYIRASPDEAKAKILEGIKKANDKKSADGRKFGEKLEANELPATDAKLEG